MRAGLVNPFRPGKPANAQTFGGRKEEVEALDRILRQTAGGNSEHFVITGPRGIGKSSLLNSALRRARQIADGNGKVFATAEIRVTDGDTVETTVAKISASLQAAVAEHHRVLDALRRAWGFAQRVEAQGVAIREETPVAVGEMPSRLTSALEESWGLLQEYCDGIVLFIDEADSAGPEIGFLLKALVDTMASRELEHVTVGIAGLPSVLEGLAKGHGSSVRSLTPIPLDFMLPGEAGEIARNGVGSVEGLTITDEAVDAIVALSGGRPHFVQTYAFYALECDLDDEVDLRDVLSAVSLKAIPDRLGVGMLDVPFFSGLDDEARLSIVEVALGSGTDWFTPDELARTAACEAESVAETLEFLQSRGALLADYDVSDRYRFPSLSLAGALITYIESRRRHREAESTGGED